MIFFNKKNNKNYLKKLYKIPITSITTLYTPVDFYNKLIQLITCAKKRIYLVMLYFEKDQSGRNILNTLYKAKIKKPNLDIAIFVDFHRANRNYFGVDNNYTNADWYFYMSGLYPNVNIPIYGVPIHNKEILGVLHLKGFVIDSYLIYTGASINDTYLQQFNKYRYDSYKIIYSKSLADSFLNYIKTSLVDSTAIVRLNEKPKNLNIKNNIKYLRKHLKRCNYVYKGNHYNDILSVTPLVGLGRNSYLNKTIRILLESVQKYLIICTPYFNLPYILKKLINKLLIRGKKIQIITNDKQANDFYNIDSKFNVIPYLYEINLRNFAKNLQNYIDSNTLSIYLWKHKCNSFHVKGIWIDDIWQLITGSNLNIRSWRLDLENALLIHDPKHLLRIQRKNELNLILKNTKKIKHFSELENIETYPTKEKKLIRKILKIQLDKIIKYIL